MLAVTWTPRSSRREITGAREPSLQLNFCSNINSCGSNSTRRSARRRLRPEGWTWPEQRTWFAGATLTVEDDRHDYGEVRYVTIGFLDEAMVVLV